MATVVETWDKALIKAIRRKDRVAALKVLNKQCPPTSPNELAGERISMLVMQGKARQSMASLASHWASSEHVSEVYNNLWDVPIGQIKMPVRAINVLEEGGYFWVGQLQAATRSDILAIEQIGPHLLGEIQKALADFLNDWNERKKAD